MQAIYVNGFKYILTSKYSILNANDLYLDRYFGTYKM